MAIGVNKPAFKPGIAAKDGKLYVFSKYRVQVLRGWPEMAAWTKSIGQPQWSRFRPQIDLSRNHVYEHKSGHRFSPPRQRIDHFLHYQVQALVPELEIPMPDEFDDAAGEVCGSKTCQDGLDKWIRDREAREDELRAEFFATIPAEVRSAVQSFPTRQWHLLVLAARCEGGLELIRSNPALAFCLSSCWAFRECQSSEAVRIMRRLVARKRRHICEKLGFPAEQRCVNVLQKVACAACSVPWLLSLRERLQEPSLAQSIAHLPTLNVPVLSLLLSNKLSHLATMSLLLELTELGSGHAGASVCEAAIRDTLMMAEQLGEAHLLRPFRSTDHVVKVHDQLAQRLNRQGLRLDREFPRPPVAGTDAIVPLTTLKMLYGEGAEQHNCAVSRAGLVTGGHAYVYRVLSPERATLELVRSGRKWRLNEIKAGRNGEVRTDTILAVSEWLAGSSNAIPVTIDIPF
jgi:hypothetical protein